MNDLCPPPEYAELTVNYANLPKFAVPCIPEPEEPPPPPPKPTIIVEAPNDEPPPVGGVDLLAGIGDNGNDGSQIDHLNAL